MCETPQKNSFSGFHFFAHFNLKMGKNSKATHPEHIISELKKRILPLKITVLNTVRVVTNV